MRLAAKGSENKEFKMTTPMPVCDIKTHKKHYDKDDGSIKSCPRIPIGGGPNAGTIGLLTDAVISVVGKKACGLIGISVQAGMPMDSGFLQLPSNNVSTGISTTNGSDLNSASTWGISASSNASLSASEDLVTNYSPVQMVTDLNVTSETYNISDSVICTCSCHTVMQGLQEEKLRLQIRVLKKQLGEE
ncbi:uncharacterized protein LOC128205910 [Mya arenaria]|uniref:uncharacterized protein LOC128205910 n=1 Tax=Mya arenaria TaxID=6604 RepID=UPI0022E0CD95|nr:uncharacterized protein LOC128205910 [Mya arenaria]